MSSSNFGRLLEAYRLNEGIDLEENWDRIGNQFPLQWVRRGKRHGFAVWEW